MLSALPAIGWDTVSLGWQASASTNVISYQVYRNGTALALFDPMPGTNQTCTVPLTLGLNRFTVTAVNAFGESDHSNEVTVTNSAPVTISLFLEASDALGEWLEVGRYEFQEPMEWTRMYRARLEIK
jgi:hypothetical protein